MLNYSPNMLKTFQTCPKKYWFKYVVGLSVPQKTSVFEKGKKIHALANYYLKGNDVSKLETQLNDGEKAAWNSLKNNNYFQKQYVNSEYNISCKVGDYWIGGRLDAVVKDEAGMYILDYKTGAVPENAELDFQTAVYLLCLNCIFPENKLSFIYIDLKNNQDCIIDFNNDKKLKYETLIKDVCKMIEESNYGYVIQTKACDKCEYRKFCK